MAVNRINLEMKEMKNNKDPHAGKLIEVVGDDVRQWRVSFIGPKDTPFSDGEFILRIIFPAQYPFTPIQVTFETKVYHPNISEKGEICLDILKNSWSPALNVGQTIMSICSLLNQPNVEDPLVPEIANQYKSDREKYEATVREYVKKFATPKK